MNIECLKFNLKKLRILSFLCFRSKIGEQNGRNRSKRWKYSVFNKANRLAPKSLAPKPSRRHRCRWFIVHRPQLRCIFTTTIIIITTSIFIRKMSTTTTTFALRQVFRREAFWRQAIRPPFRRVPVRRHKRQRKQRPLATTMTMMMLMIPWMKIMLMFQACDKYFWLWYFIMYIKFRKFHWLIITLIILGLIF